MADDQLPLPHLHPRILLPSQVKAPSVVPQPPSLSSPCPPGPAFPPACSCPSPGAHSIGPASVPYCWPLQHTHLHPLGSCILPPNPGGKHWLDREVFFPGDHNLSSPPLHPSATLSLPRPGGKFHLFPPAGDTPCDTSWRVGGRPEEGSSKVLLSLRGGKSERLERGVGHGGKEARCSEVEGGGGTEAGAGGRREEAEKKGEIVWWGGGSGAERDGDTQI